LSSPIDLFLVVPTVALILWLVRKQTAGPAAGLPNAQGLALEGSPLHSSLGWCAAGIALLGTAAGIYFPIQLVVHSEPLGQIVLAVFLLLPSCAFALLAHFLIRSSRTRIELTPGGMTYRNGSVTTHLPWNDVTTVITSGGGSLNLTALQFLNP
jgi:hypothetical protein